MKGASSPDTPEILHSLPGATGAALFTEAGGIPGLIIGLLEIHA